MIKVKGTKKHSSFSLGRLAELQLATLIASVGSSTRLEGSKLSDKDVGRILNTVSGRKS